MQSNECEAAGSMIAAVIYVRSTKLVSRRGRAVDPARCLSEAQAIVAAERLVSGEGIVCDLFISESDKLPGAILWTFPPSDGCW